MWLCLEGDPLGIVKEIEIWTYKQMIYAQARICPRKWEEQACVGF